MVLWVVFFMLRWMFQHDYFDTYCFECLICMCFAFLYLHLFSAIEHVSHGKALYKYAHYYYYYFHPARSLMSQGRCCGLLTRCQSTVTVRENNLSLLCNV